MALREWLIKKLGGEKIKVVNVDRICKIYTRSIVWIDKQGNMKERQCTMTTPEEFMKIVEEVREDMGLKLKSNRKYGKKN